MNKPPIIVIGSSNTDMVIKAKHLPSPGETILGGSFFMNAGGKGANQAVAAARLGGYVQLVAKVGRDVFGKEAIALLKKEGVDTSSILRDKILPSGIALITVDEKGENCIAVASGSNANLLKQDIEKIKSKIQSAGIVLMQLETPIPTIICAASLAFEKNITVILNPAPAIELPDELLNTVSIITPNEKEAGMLTGIEVTDMSSAKVAALALRHKGVQTVIITLGAQGAMLLYENEFYQISSPKVDAVDTTAAGDVFNGALSVAVAEGLDMREAVTFACRAASISVTRLGAQSSAPFRNEI